MIKTGETIRIYYVTVLVALYALMAAVSISLQQIFFGLALLAWIVSFFLLRKSNQDLPAMRWRSFYLLFILWAAWRLVHVFMATSALDELYQARELWLMLMMPLVADVIAALRIKPSNGKAIQLWGLPPLYFVLLFLVFGGAVVGLFNLVQFVYEGGILTTYRAQALNNNNALTYSGTAALTLVLSFGFLLVARKWQQRPKYLLPVLWASFLLLVAAFILAKSRGGYIALVMLVGFMSLVILKRKAVFAWLGLAVVVVALWFSLPALRETFYEAMPQQGSHEGTMQARLDMWAGGIAMVKANPLVGYGETDFSSQFPKFRVEGAVGAGANPTHMHNDLLNTWVLYGGVGLIIFVMFFVLPLYDFLIIDRIARKHEMWPLMTAALAGIWFMVFMGLSQCHFTDEEVQTLFWLSVSVFYGLRDQVLAAKK